MVKWKYRHWYIASQVKSRFISLPKYEVTRCLSLPAHAPYVYCLCVFPARERQPDYNSVVHSLFLACQYNSIVSIFWLLCNNLPVLSPWPTALDHPPSSPPSFRAAPPHLVLHRLTLVLGSHTTQYIFPLVVFWLSKPYTLPHSLVCVLHLGPHTMTYQSGQTWNKQIQTPSVRPSPQRLL